MYFGIGDPVTTMNISPFDGHAQPFHHPAFCTMDGNTLQGQLMEPFPYPCLNSTAGPEPQLHLQQQLCAMPFPGNQRCCPVPWNHTVPSCVPWFQSNSPFPSQDMCFDSDVPRRGMSCKRKGVHFDESSSACKQYISEEVMAAHMNRLHISSGHHPSTNEHPLAQEAVDELGARLAYSSVDAGSKPTDRVVILSPELKRIQDEPIIPKSILEKMQKPSMELVLWKPPGGVIDQFIKDTLAERTLRTVLGVKGESGMDALDGPPAAASPDSRHNPSWDVASAFSISTFTIPSLPDVEKLSDEMMC